MDIIDEIARAHREVRDDGGTKALLLTRHYDAEPEDVWDACTSAERIGRWLLPVSGDLRLGGTYQLEGNAGGRILRCEPPRLLAVTWVYGVPPDAEDAPFSEVEVRLTPEGSGIRFELRHTAAVPEEMWARYGPGATGVGWDLAVLGLALHLTTGDTGPGDDTMHQTPEGRAFITASSRAWGEAFLAAGAPPEQAEATTRATTDFYAPPWSDRMTQKITPFLMFEGRAEEAMTFYLSLFEDSELIAVTRYGPGEEGAEGSVKHATFRLAGQEYMCSDSSVRHPFTFTPSLSLYVRCASREEIDRLFKALSEEGGVLMPLDTYEFADQFAWVADRFGVSWQLSLP